MCPNKYWSRSQHSKLVVECLRYDTSGRPLNIVTLCLCVWKCLQMGSKHLQSGRPLQRCILECPNMYCLSSQGSKVVAARMRCDRSGRPLDIASATCNAPKWATDTSRAVDRSRGAFLSVLTCTMQVLKAQMWSLQA